MTLPQSLDIPCGVIYLREDAIKILVCISFIESADRIGTPSHVSLKISDTHDSISVFPCDEDDVMAFRVPTKLLTDHKCVMRINSKRFILGIMKTNNLDTGRTYTLSGEYLKEKNAAVFSLVNGITLRALRTESTQ